MRLLTLILSLLCINAFAYTGKDLSELLPKDYDASCEIGDDYFFARNGKIENKKEAFTWYKISAENGHSRGQFNFGCCYSKGDGVSKDQAEAVKWWRKSAMQGYSSALYSLGWCYEKGDGTLKDQVEAYAYYNLAAINGEKYRESRDRIEKVLTPEQIESGLKRSKELLKQIEDSDAAKQKKWWQFWRWFE